VEFVGFDKYKQLNMNHVKEGMMGLCNDSYRTIIMNPGDHVAVALQDIPANTKISVRFPDDVDTTMILREDIDFGHKFAVKAIKQGSEIFKYGEVIGRALRDIQMGEHVHVHNLEGTRGRGDKIGTN
jgi:altronate dehydratase small subunit